MTAGLSSPTEACRESVSRRSTLGTAQSFWLLPTRGSALAS